jgi:hypothetical protein
LLVFGIKYSESLDLGNPVSARRSCLRELTRHFNLLFDTSNEIVFEAFIVIGDYLALPFLVVEHPPTEPLVSARTPLRPLGLGTPTTRRLAL